VTEPLPVVVQRPVSLDGQPAAPADTLLPPAPPAAKAYPENWEADVLLADGGVVHLRPSSPADAEQIRAMHSRTSARTLYLRYFSAVAQVSDQQVALFISSDYDSSAGLVAVLGGQIIAAGAEYLHLSTASDWLTDTVLFATRRKGLRPTSAADRPRAGFAPTYQGAHR